MSGKTDNFWNSCPRNLDYLPATPCPLGKNATMPNSNTLPTCQWHINSKEDNYCFWTWLRRTSDANGNLEPMTQTEISELLKIPSGKITQQIEEAVKNLKNTNIFKELESD